MIKSMTGYGRGETIGGGKKWSVEMKSVNHRFLDMSIKIPRSHSLLEEKIREVIRKKISRGRIEVYVKMQDEYQENRQVKLNKELMRAYYCALEEISEVLSISSKLNVIDIAQMPEVLVIEDQEHNLEGDWNYLQAIILQALEQLSTMRIKEGQELYKDFLAKAALLKDVCVFLHQKAPNVVKEYQEKLEKRLKDAVEHFEIDEGRLLTEVAMMSDKMSIDEEIVRLESHIKQFETEILSKDAVGRKLDFLIQELNREINTIGSKSNSYEISSLVIEVKTNIEKMREQVQNVE